ncbi:MAG: class I SAM-dependent DNA methyltransferase [Polaromonas sp.]|uniref:class I SAM-dependent DNA methyltransferase n=3 Tax=Polaromonas sp. TaxID=1869339 RepID=UPI0027179FAD|nr:DNA methyltransferase [Polaromonas sp.]MDO9115327.1 class I SAM-dependent DNA methyltransferase [Polaromonas sp.]
MDDAQSKSDNDEQTSRASAFVERWQGVTASELSTAQSFVRELCELLGVPVPHATPEQDYMFERPVTFSHGDGSTSPGRIDCYRRGHFVLESKKLKSSTQTKGFDDALLRARAQAESYARALPPEEGRPPFLLVVDVGNVIELYSEFTRSGATYTPFPDPRSHRITLASLVKAEVRERLKTLWTDPDNLNPSRASARVTREVAGQLAELARSLEQSGHRADHVAAFLTRSLFSMFAEDVELLPKGSFLGLLQAHRAQPVALQQMLRVLWADMDRGGFSAALATQVLKFNGKLFKESTLDGYSLLLTQEQTDRLIRAAQANWREVEPAIFGTLLERALDPTERHALGAHYTPRAYVERLVLPTVVEPLRADWANVQAAALVLAREAAELSGKAQDAKQEEARAELRKFHHQLCTVRVLDPACGSGNFLYVTLEHLKRLEGEVINQLEALGETQSLLGLEGETVTPQQLLGIELNDRAAALAELVLWIGYLQWHIRTRGNKAVAEPVVHDYGNIEHRDAVLAWDDTDLAYDENGQLLSRWDGTTFKAHPVTGALVPDEAAQVPQWSYIKPRQAEWPKADFIVGNPPFIGASTMRAALGNGYVQALRGAWPEVPESADFVMYWWSRAAQTVRAGKARRFGLITTNSLRQTFNRRVVEAHLNPPPARVPTREKPSSVRAEPVEALALAFAIPDHPWVDSANGAAVRIAMTVAMRGSDTNLNDLADMNASLDLNAPHGRLLTVMGERPGEHGEVNVLLSERQGQIHADLSVGANVASAGPLRANENLSNRGVQLFGAGFIVTPEEAALLLPLPLGEGRGEGQPPQHIIRDYRNGRDLTDAPRGVKVIDAFGLTSEQLRGQFPAVYQWLLERVKPERDQNNRAGRRDNWWLFGETNPKLRKQLAGLARYIATVETAKHRTFQFVDASILPDNMLVAVASSDAFHLGVLSSSSHVVWSLATGGRLGVGNDPRYNKSRCFETFPFPDDDTGLTPALRQHIAALAEQIDAHRKRQQAAHPGLSLTGMYNVLEALREGRELTAKEKAIHTQGLVSVLKDLHDELDAAVLQAYGLEPGLSNDALLTQLVALNARRAAEEKTGRIRWLRPEFQNPAPRQTLPNQELSAPTRQGLQAEMVLENEAKPAAGKTPGQATQPWPASLPAQVRALAEVLAGHPGALTVAEIEARFKGRGPWKKSLPRILETLEALGRARRDGESWRE